MRKKILFIYNSYNGYHDKIIYSLNKFNYDLTTFSLTPNINNLFSIINDLSKGKYILKRSMQLQNDFFYKLGNFDYDYVFVLTGRRLSQKILEYLRDKCNKTKFILYLWDDIARVEGMLNNIHFFDIIYSFDTNDCKKYGFKFLPLFYTNDFTSFSLEKQYDCFYCGVLHKGRYELLEKIVNFSDVNNLKFKSALICSFFGYYKRFFLDYNFRKKYINYCNNKTLSLNEFAKYLCSSKVTFDMPIKTQTGLSMRCIESLPAQTKIITTNEHIKEYDFYCPENVMIIDRENPVFDVDFIKSPYKPIPKEIVEKYSLENWVKQIFKD